MTSEGFITASASVMATLLVLCLIFGVLPESASCSDFTIERIQRMYEKIEDIKGSFVQKSTIKDLGRTDTFIGTFMIKVPSRMRWQYDTGDRQHTEVIINAGQIIVYQKDEKQAFKGEFDRESYGQAPIALLGGFGDIEKEFDVTAKDGKLLLKPKKGIGSVVSIEIAPSDGKFPIGSMTIVDRRSNRIEIAFRDVTVNSGIKDSAFLFTPPKGVNVYEYSKPQ